METLWRKWHERADDSLTVTEFADTLSRTGWRTTDSWSTTETIMIISITFTRAARIYTTTWPEISPAFHPFKPPSPSQVIPKTPISLLQRPQPTNSTCSTLATNPLQQPNKNIYTHNMKSWTNLERANNEMSKESKAPRQATYRYCICGGNSWYEGLTLCACCGCKTSPKDCTCHGTLLRG